VLHVLNRELAADFDVELRVSFRRGEELRTEISAKFTWARLERDLRAAGLTLERWFTDPERRFAVTLARR
jgi:L-histidine N-alpha-methyltransferase